MLSTSSPESSFDKFRGDGSLVLKMAEPTPQSIRLRDVLPVVPEFNGSNVPLSLLLDGLNEAKEMISKVDEANFCKLVRSRFTGEARKAIAGQAYLTIDSLKDYIKSIYAPSKTVHQLLGELGNEFQRDGESVIAFANRMRDIGGRVIEAR